MRRPPKVTCETVLVTPAMAREWLDKYNTQNFRKKDKHRVTRYAKDMRANRWDFNGDRVLIAVGEVKRLACTIKTAVVMFLLWPEHAMFV